MPMDALDAYELLRKAGIPRRRIITICQLQDYRKTLIMGEQGHLVEYNYKLEQVVPPRFYKKQREDIEQQCRLMLEEGGADYDFEMVNSATVWSVLTGDENSHMYHKVVPRSKCSALLFAVYSHGNSHSALNDDSMNTDAHDHLMAEWCAHFPYPPSPEQTDQGSDLLDFVATENAPDRAAPCYLYSTQLRQIFHQLFLENPERPVIGLLNYCTSGGNLDFMRRPDVVHNNFGVDRWPLFLMSLSGKSTDSLVAAGLWQSFFVLLSSSLSNSLGRGSNEQQMIAPRYTFESLCKEAVRIYHKENIFSLLNECKERVFSFPIWQLTFYETKTRTIIDPWHEDLRRYLLLETDYGQPDKKNLQELQEAYTTGKSFRIIHQRHLMETGILVDGAVVAQHPDEANHCVVWARASEEQHFTDDSLGSHHGDLRVPLKNMPYSLPYPCPITAWQGENRGYAVDLANVVTEAFAVITKPKLVFGQKTGIGKADVLSTFCPPSFDAYYSVR